MTTGSMATDISLDSKVQAMSLKKYTISGFKMTTHEANSVEESLSSENVRVEEVMTNRAFPSTPDPRPSATMPLARIGPKSNRQLCCISLDRC